MRRMPEMIAHLTWMIYLGQSRARAHHALQPQIMNMLGLYIVTLMRAVGSVFENGNAVASLRENGDDMV